MKERICALRHNLGLTQEELARKSGVTQQFIQMIERGKRSPSLRTALKLAECLGCSVEELADDRPIKPG